MPSRWLLTLGDLDLEAGPVRQEALHAVISRWFDPTREAHNAKVKPYAISPIGNGPKGPAIEIGTITESAEVALHRAARPSRRLRFGSQLATIADPPTRIATETWTKLGTASAARAWCLQLLTPTTFRRRNRSSPWLAPETVLHGLADRWLAWSTLDAIELTRTELQSVWVTDLDGRNEVLQLNGSTVSGFVGRIRYECDDEKVAKSVDRLLRLAAYIGVGSYTTKGLGVVRLEPTWAPSSRNGKPGR